MIRRLLALAPLLLAGAAPAQESAPPVAADPVPAPAAASRPYLAPGALDPVGFLPPPPQAGSEAAAADRLTYAATRALAGSPRWTLATADVAGGAVHLLADFACALGTRLDPARLPATMTLLERARLDVVRAVERPKGHFGRVRPQVGNDLPICVARTEALARSPSYPSGHATEGWTFALILAAAAPDHATAILRRGRIYGESRLVCGVHWRSDVEAGRTTGAAVVAGLLGSAEFRADLDRARGEIAAAATVAPDGAACALEEAAAAAPLP
ncbi:acid phosphatase [Methylobacterium sp. JK268]